MNQLRAILAVDVKTAEARINSARSLFRDEDRPLILVGCGPLGRHTARTLASIGRPIEAFSDNNSARWGTRVLERPVLGPDDAVHRYASDAIFVVTIYNGALVRDQFAALGCRYVEHFAALFHAYGGAFLPYYAIVHPSAVLAQVDQIEAAHELWHDDFSRKEFVAQISWDVGAKPVHEKPDPMKDLYLAPDLFLLDEDDVIVDCGAFDGDSLRVFLGDTAHRFGRYVALEPDPDNFARLAEYVTSLPNVIQEKITLEPVAAASSAGEVRFSASGTVSSKSSADGTVLARADTLDSLVGPAHPSFIKMDIEGQELDALRGAKSIIETDQPILAISLYHRATDLWQIPSLIHRMAPGYRLFLRRYAEDCWETVCYAIPPGRQLRSRFEPAVSE